MKSLHKAIEAAGDELIAAHGWGLDDDEKAPVLTTIFARVLLKHLEPIFDHPFANAALQTRIAALRAEIETLEKLT